jgi:hypothetical protein
LNTDLSIDKNFKLTERVRMQFRLDLFNLLNHANFRGDQTNGLAGASTTFATVNCGVANVAGMYVPCSPTNNVISHQTLTNGFGQATSVVGNAGRELQYGLHFTF